MKLKYISGLFLTLSMAYVATSCIEDESMYNGNPVPVLNVTTAATKPGELPELNFYSGQECVITPDVNYTGNGTLSYEWSVGTYEEGVKGELEVVSHERELRHVFPKGGVYYAHLDITDGSVGVVQEYQVNVNRTFEKGYILVANDANNIGNLTFIRDLTPEEVEGGQDAMIIEHAVESVNEHVGQDNLAGVTIIRQSYPADTPRLVASYGGTTYFLDPNTFIVAAEINHEGIVPGFKAKNVIGGMDAVVHDPVTNRYILLLYADMMGLEKEAGLKGHSFDKYVFNSVYQYGSLSYDNYTITKSPMQVAFIASSSYYDMLVTTDELKDSDGNPLYNGHTYRNLFMGQEAYYTWHGNQYEYTPAYTISSKNGKYYYTRLRGDANMFELAYEGRGEIAVTDNTALPDEDACFAVSDKYARTYYVSDNKVYVLLVSGNNMNLADKNQYALSYPSAEEVTYMTVNTDTDELLVATVNKTTGRGNVYIYDVADVRTDSPDAKAKVSYPNCSDRISYITYKQRY